MFNYSNNTKAKKYACVSISGAVMCCVAIHSLIVGLVS